MCLFLPSEATDRLHGIYRTNLTGDHKIERIGWKQEAYSQGRGPGPECVSCLCTSFLGTTCVNMQTIGGQLFVFCLSARKKGGVEK